MNKKTILLLHTGGTIAMHNDPHKGTIILDEQNGLLQQNLSLENFADLIEKEVFHLPSPHITLQHMLTLRNAIEGNLQQHAIDGVVITHGTDTLEETAYFLSLTTNFSIPIVLTGAMRSANEIGADGSHNLMCAVRVACDEQAHHKGVLVVMNDEIHHADYVTKTSTSNVATFQSPQYGPIGIVAKTFIQIAKQPIKRHYLPVQSISKRVALLTIYAGMDGDLIDMIESLHYDGLVIEGLGQGNVPPIIAEKLLQLVIKGIPIVLVSRCYKGIAEGIYGYEGGGKLLQEAGIIFAQGLNGPKARLKLILFLQQTNPKLSSDRIF